MYETESELTVVSSENPPVNNGILNVNIEVRFWEKCQRVITDVVPTSLTRSSHYFYAETVLQ